MEFGAGFAAGDYDGFRRGVANAFVDVLFDARKLNAADGLAFAQRGQREFAALEAMHLAAMKASGASDRDVERKSAAGGTRSRKETSKITKRANAVGQNPDLAKKLGAGDIGEEQLDALALASAKSDGDAATDTELITEIENAKPDDAGKITQKWLERRDEDSTQTRFDQQNKNRGARKGHDRATGCDTFTMRGPSERINELNKRTEQRANEMYLADGGRDVADDQHPRTHQQRMFDAAYELLMNESTGGSKASSAAPHPRSMIHVSLTVDTDDERLIRGECPDGAGYLPGSVLEKYGCGSIIAGTVFNLKGEPIWFGRHKRYATPAQFAALIARDEGCVLCGRDPAFCEAHHIMPFNSAKQGETNVEDMAMVCKSCHHWLHDSKRTLIWQHAPPNRGPNPDSDGSESSTGAYVKGARRIWKTRRATPDEIAPPQRKNQKPNRDPRKARPTRPARAA